MERPGSDLDSDGELKGGTKVVNRRKLKKEAKEIAKQNKPSTSRLNVRQSNRGGRQGSFMSKADSKKTGNTIGGKDKPQKPPTSLKSNSIETKPNLVHSQVKKSASDNSFVQSCSWSSIVNSSNISQKLTEKQSAVNKLIKPVLNVDSSMNKQLSNTMNNGYSEKNVSCKANTVVTTKEDPSIKNVDDSNRGGCLASEKSPISNLVIKNTETNKRKKPEKNILAAKENLENKENDPLNSQGNVRLLASSTGSSNASSEETPRKRFYKENLIMCYSHNSMVYGVEFKREHTPQKISELFDVYENNYSKTKEKAEKYIKLEDAYKLLKRDEVTGKTFEELMVADSNYFYEKIHDLIMTKVKCSTQDGKEKMVYVSSDMYIKRARKFLFGEEKRDEGLASEAIWGAFVIEVALFYKEFKILLKSHNSSQTLARFAAEWYYKQYPSTHFRSIIRHMNKAHQNYYTGNASTEEVYEFLDYVEDFCMHFKKIDKEVFKKHLEKFLPTDKATTIDSIFLNKKSIESKIGGCGPYWFEYVATDYEMKDEQDNEQSKGSADGGECSTSMTTGAERAGGSQVAGRGRNEWISGRGLPVCGSNDSTRGSKSWNNVISRGAIKRGGSR